MMVSDLCVGREYLEPWEESHTDCTLVYMGQQLITPENYSLYGFEEPCWGFRWLNEAEIAEIKEKEIKHAGECGNSK